MRALGIDVAANRDLDLVLMAGGPDDLRLEREPFHASPDTLRRTLDDVGRVDVIAIDSPPVPGLRGSSREVERDLHRRGIGIFWTPTSWDSPFYDWMKVGQRTFEAVEGAGYSLYTGVGQIRGMAIEVFPHASAVALQGAVWPARTTRSKRRKKEWRRRVLAANGLADVSALRNLDMVDAALAAATGLYALAGESTAIGEADDGVIVVPTRSLRDRYPREPAT